jgi:hypothetical protein
MQNAGPTSDSSTQNVGTTRIDARPCVRISIEILNLHNATQGEQYARNDHREQGLAVLEHERSGPKPCLRFEECFAMAFDAARCVRYPPGP